MDFKHTMKFFITTLLIFQLLSFPVCYSSPFSKSGMDKSMVSKSIDDQKKRKFFPSDSRLYQLAIKQNDQKLCIPVIDPCVFLQVLQSFVAAVLEKTVQEKNVNEDFIQSYIGQFNRHLSDWFDLGIPGSGRVLYDKKENFLLVYLGDKGFDLVFSMVQTFLKEHGQKKNFLEILDSKYFSRLSVVYQYNEKEKKCVKENLLPPIKEKWTFSNFLFFYASMYAPFNELDEFFEWVPKYKSCHERQRLFRCWEEQLVVKI
ncbi:hypothetical protein HMI54_004996 [Coelomomyces lativittatus]|nr:hypothetical protein HMI55_005270 [Coelomomyces lativittatus]KAJ1515236.1 hypothetical protein HMI56_006265 [Coelomomyces lativittatus]KAJ1517620.1 hypothetical protein HMI54_004996 [Coelomomyces lativittatus]